MDRIESFRRLEWHPALGKVFARLSVNEVRACETFLTANAEKDFGDFALAAPRWFLDIPKPKNWSLMVELVGSANFYSKGGI